MASHQDSPKRRQTRFHGRIEHPDGRACASAGCAEPGEFKAPDEGGGWRWMCLDHVRAFNAGYNYFDGMTPEEIAAAQSPHPSWQRATRAFASNAYADGFRDPHDLFGRAQTMRTRTPGGSPLSEADRKALSALGLDVTAKLKDIRRRYTELVRAYHPDRNGGDRSHEGKLRGVIDAYTHLKRAAAFAA